MDILVDDCWAEVAANATCSAILNLGATCKHLHKILRDNGLWRQLVDRDYYSVSAYNIGEPYVEQYKFLHGIPITDATTRIAIKKAVRSNRMDAVRFVFAYLDNMGILADIPNGAILSAISIGNLAMLELPEIKAHITNRLITNSRIRITQPHILDWLTMIPMNINVEVLRKLVHNPASTEGDLLSIMPWFIERDILPTPSTLHDCIKHNHKQLYLLLHDIGLSAHTVDADDCCKLGNLDMLQILKGHGVMPTANGLYLAYKNKAPLYIFQWLKRNNIDADGRFINLAIERCDIKMLEMFGKNYEYGYCELADVAKTNNIALINWITAHINPTQQMMLAFLVNENQEHVH